MFRTTPRSFPFQLTVFCLLLIALYAIGIFSRAIWFDEAITIQSLATAPLDVPAAGFVDLGIFKPSLTGTTTLPRLIDHYINIDIHPPVYFTVAHLATLVFGNDLVVVRFVSAALILASVLIFARSLRRLQVTHIWAYLLIYGFSFAAVTTAQDARGYAMAVLLSMAAWHVLLLMAEDRAEGRRIALSKDIALGLICGLMLLTHYFALFAAVPILGWRFLGGLWRRDMRCFIAPIITFFVFLPWFPVMLDHLGARPGQMLGFLGLVEWIKRMAQYAPGQIFSVTSPDVPLAVQAIGRRIVLALLVIGGVRALWPTKSSSPQRIYGWIAVWVPAVGLVLFLITSVIMNRWFDTLRYLLFFAPFIIYLAALGTLTIVEGLAKLRLGVLAIAPVASLVIAEITMINYGWETNRNRGGNYFKTWATAVADAGPGQSLIIVDVGDAYGNLLAAAYTLPAGTEAYLLDQDSTTWSAAAAEMDAALSDQTLAVLAYTIDRGTIGDDKATLYAPIVAMLESNGFTRVAADPIPQGDRFYAKWER
ncbi:MAG: glycosyltransferase family 39 protein [Pseudomonadota bacterium]